MRRWMQGLLLLGLLLLRVPTVQSTWSVRLAWNAPTTYVDGTPAPPEVIGGYRLYYGTSSGTYSQRRDVGNVLEAVLDTLVDGETYYVVATALDLAETESAFSMPELVVPPPVVVPPPDTTPPQVAITAPGQGDTVARKSTVTITVAAQDDVAVVQVVVLVNNAILCTRSAPPYACAWAVPAANRRTYALTARAYDAAANVGTAAVVTVTAADAPGQGQGQGR